MSSIDEEAKKAVGALRQGGVIAYPTEAVFGFGCDPYNLDAVSQILQIKHRAIEKGFILVASSFNQVESLIEPLPPHSMLRVQESWPGPITWVFPAKPEVPSWITGHRKTVAIRVSAHPAIQAICALYGKPIISTSANIQGQSEARDYRTTMMGFKEKVDFIFNGKVGPQLMPTEIRNAVTGEIVRIGETNSSGHSKS